MIKSGGFTYRRFFIAEHIPVNRIKAIGDFVIGVPQGQFPEFERDHTHPEWQEILRRILTTGEQRELGRSLGRSIKPETNFTLWPSTDYAAIIETQPTLESTDGKKFWVTRA
jgi:hypothetical protein